MDWTKDRIQTLTKPEVKQLRANAERLQEPEVVALCDEVQGQSGKGRDRTPGQGRQTEEGTQRCLKNSAARRANTLATSSAGAS
jgi:hypothetical protein